MERIFQRELLGVSLFVASYVIAAGAAALATGNAEFGFYIAVMLVLIGVVLVLHTRVGLSRGLLWSLAGWGALHMAGGLVPVPDTWAVEGEFRVLYSWWILPGGDADHGGWLKFDQLVHAYGFGVATWLCWQALCGALGAPGAPATPTPTPGLLVLVAAAGCGLGALNEVVEFVATRFTSTNVGGYENTSWDLIYNTLGAATAATCLYVAHRRRQRV